MESSIVTLKGEREFLKKTTEKIRNTNIQLSQFKCQKSFYYEAETQTETDGEVNKSILIDTLRSRNEELEKENIKLNEKIKQKGAGPGHSGKIVSSLACQAIQTPTTSDKHVPANIGEQNIQYIQSEFEAILSDNDILKQETQKIAIQINQENKDHEETKTKIKELDSRCRTLKEQLEKSEIDVEK